MTDSAKHDVPGAKAANSAKAATTAGQAGAEPAEAQDDAAPAATAEGDGADARADSAKPDIDEVKRKFREALDKKRQIHAEGQDQGGRDPNKIHGAHGPAASRRSFRRKSG
jgi:hypothetical protein